MPVVTRPLTAYICGAMSERFVKPKLATELPPERELGEADAARLAREAREWREAVDVHAARVESIDQEDLRVRVR